MIELNLDGKFATSLGPVLTARLCFLPRHVLEILLIEHINIEDNKIIVDTEGIIQKIDHYELCKIR
jgi:hypothetical protein